MTYLQISFQTLPPHKDKKKESPERNKKGKREGEKVGEL